MKKLINGICVGLGVIFFGIGALGAAIPILPTTPFLLLAGILFAKGSERFHKWFLSTGLYKKYIDEIVKTKRMTLRAKVFVLLTITIMFSIGFLAAPVWPAKVLIMVILLFHYYYFLFRIKTNKN